MTTSTIKSVSLFFHRVVLFKSNQCEEAEAVTLPTTHLNEMEMVKARDGIAFKVLNEDKLKVKFIITSCSYD